MERSEGTRALGGGREREGKEEGGREADYRGGSRKRKVERR